ncbi:alpha/beta hydrolase [Azospirillum sp. RWY-5-1]|uniref:Alpha/beta hydrolase n=1 Tax=Azospirillum oleiclasticum TaxID=2735135 RepID=A0ABX2TGS3_9PROT|nr:alpha/beta hydrolase [Azospirillum oleiclasticum]NYZ23552.1 alpha/beta hydrolase [Azospirillum oleiclasticum]
MIDIRQHRAGVILGAAAVALAAAAAVHNVRRARRAERDNPSRGRFVEVDGVRLHVLERGAGPPVLLIHGNVVTAEDFAVSGVMDRLARTHRVIAIDRPGMGYSDRPRDRLWTPDAQADLLLHAMERLGVVRPVIVGHSLGAMVATALALRHPDAVRGLVLAGGYFYPTARPDVALTLPPAVPVVGDLLRYTVSPLFGAVSMPALLKGMFNPCPVPRAYRDGHDTDLALRPGQIRAMAEDGTMMVPAAAAMRNHYGELHMAVAILAGTEDVVVFPAGQSERLHRDIPHATLRLIPGVGHMLHHADPDAVAEAVETVFRQSGETVTREERPRVAAPM